MPSRRARVALGRRRRHAPRVCAALVEELHRVEHLKVGDRRRRARVTRDQRRRHAPRICVALVGELHAARSRGTPTLPALELRRPNEKGNLSGETTFSARACRDNRALRRSCSNEDSVV